MSAPTEAASGYGEYVDEVVRAYVTCAIWTATDENEAPAPPDAEVEPDDEAAAYADCLQFISDNGPLLFVTPPWSNDPAQIGHDFWLTRNSHGAGFWDRGAGEAGEVLSESARAAGGIDIIYEEGRLYWGG